MLQELGKWLIFVGIIIVGLGVIIYIFPKYFPYLGKLPGDIFIKRENFTFYFPLGTCILLSILLSLLLTLFFFIIRSK
jgi:hypothetical protein